MHHLPALNADAHRFCVLHAGPFSCHHPHLDSSKGPCCGAHPLGALQYHRTDRVDVGPGVHQGSADQAIQLAVHIEPPGVPKAAHQGALALEGQWGWQQVFRRQPGARLSWATWPGSSQRWQQVVARFGRCRPWGTEGGTQWTGSPSPTSSSSSPSSWPAALTCMGGQRVHVGRWLASACSASCRASSSDRGAASLTCCASVPGKAHAGRHAGQGPPGALGVSVPHCVPELVVPLTPQLQVLIDILTTSQSLADGHSWQHTLEQWWRNININYLNR